MKKILIYTLLAFILFIPTKINASTNTYPRDENNLGVRDWIKDPNSKKDYILSTPKVNSNEKIYDFADLINDEDEQKIYDNLINIIDEYKTEIVIVTIDENNKINEEEYASDFYDYNDFGKLPKRTGIILLIDMDNRGIWITAFGDAVLYFDDYRREAIIDNLVDNYILNEDYGGAANTFVNEVDNYMKKGISTSNQGYKIDEYGNLVEVKSVNWVLSTIVSLILSIIVTIVAVSKHKMVKLTTHASDYLEKNNVKLYTPIDTFLTTHTSVTRISSNTGSGGSRSGGSSMSRGSSGGSRSGSGRRF